MVSLLLLPAVEGAAVVNKGVAAGEVQTVVVPTLVQTVVRHCIRTHLAVVEVVVPPASWVVAVAEVAWPQAVEA
jgi:hypothetical protein